MVAVLMAVARPAAAQQDESLRLMNEPAEYTDVVDAFDEGDPFDFEFHIGYRRIRRTGTIQREVNDSRAAGGRGSANFTDIADWKHVRNMLDLGVDIGLYRDLALYARLPVVLSDNRSLSLPGDRSAGEVAEELRAIRGDSGSMPLFNVPFDSPTRSGLDRLDVGLAWAIFNQHRSPDVPTWVVMAEGRFNVSEEMHACEDVADGTRCNPSDQGPGVGRGTNGLRLETRTSRRYRYVEPYMGIGFQIEWPGKADDFFAPSGDLDGYMNTLPPRQADLTAGITVVPWENRGRWQRLSLDFRIKGTWLSEGREYSPLFDALGSSQSPHLTEPNLEGIPSEDTALREVPFRGLTDVEARGRVGGRLTVAMQAARYVRFSLGLGVFYDTPYFLTFTDACNPNVNPSSNTDPRRGRCRDGIINPHHRPTIDLPGNRFRLDGAITLDVFAKATAKF
jgi:hypothetical protein